MYIYWDLHVKIEIKTCIYIYNYKQTHICGKKNGMHTYILQGLGLRMVTVFGEGCDVLGHAGLFSTLRLLCIRSFWTNMVLPQDVFGEYEK